MNFTNNKIVQGAVFLLALLLTACGGGATGGGNTPGNPVPKVSSTSPANLATGVAPNAAITATFSAPVKVSTVSPATFTLSNGATGNAIGNVSCDGMTATFTPSPTSPLASGTTYTATITTGVESVAGTAMASPYTWTFTTGTVLDTIPPTVTSTSPDSGATNVTTNSAITATFSENMDASTVIATNPANFTLKNGTTNVQGEVTYNGTTATFKPTNALANSTTYTATLSREIKDAAGNAMASAHTWTFTTGAAADITAPTVSSTSPANSATDVAVDAEISATFSENMDVSTVIPANFTLMNGTTSVQGTVDYIVTKAIFKPTNALANGTTYTATISRGVTDAAGNAMASARTWTFKTAGTPIPTVPTVVIAAPQTVVILDPGTTHLYSATVGGTKNTAVTWTATGGTIDNGLYTAPDTPGTYTVTATTQATPAASDTATVIVVATGTYRTPGNVTGEVVVAMDSHTTSPISPFIYGLNVADVSGAGNLATVWGPWVPKFTFNRYGGNNTTPLNWETGYSNAGSDNNSYRNYNRPLESAGGINGPMQPGPGNAVTPRINFSHARNAAQLVTVPIIGFVAKDTSGVQPIPQAPNATTPATPDPAHWLQALPLNPAGATASPNTTDGFVYTNDFVKYLDTYLDTKYGVGRDLNDPLKTVQFSLDNETDQWRNTHAEIRGRYNGSGIPTGFDELVTKDVTHADAIKSVAPNAVVWGGSFTQWDGLVHLGNSNPPSGYTYYFDYFLEKMKAAEVTAGKRLMDVVDLHWYIQATDSQHNFLDSDDLAQTDTIVNLREQAPRSLWDPYYAENSWVARAIPTSEEKNCTGGNCPIRFIPRMQERINLFYPGTKVAIGEYYYGRGGDMSAAIINADVLGIFGKYGVYAATMWPNASNAWAYNTPNNCGGGGGEDCALQHAYQCALMAIDIYRNYDGNNAKFGDMSIGTSIVDTAFTNPAAQPERVTAYASMDAGTPDRVVIVAINKATTALDTGLKITHTKAFKTAKVWQVTGVNGGDGGCTAPKPQTDITLPQTNAFNATLPAQSVTVFELK